MFRTQDQPATDNQVDFLRKLAAERQAPEGHPFPWAATGLEEHLDTFPPSKRAASAMITYLLSLPKIERPAAADTAKLEPGVYHGAETGEGDPSKLYKVYPARQHDGLLAKEIVVDEGGQVSFEYVGAAKRFVVPSGRLTLDEAKEFGSQYGVCVNCGALLTDPDSVAAGIGPICAGKV